MRIARTKIIPFRSAMSTFDPRFQPEYAPMPIPARMASAVAGHEDHHRPDKFLAYHGENRDLVDERVSPVPLKGIHEVQEILLEDWSIKTVYMVERFNNVRGA